MKDVNKSFKKEKTLTEKIYWLEKFSKKFKISSFTYDIDDQEVEHYKIKTFHYKFPEKISTRLIQICNKSDETMHAMFVAGISLLLKRYSGNNDIIIGSPIYKQEKEGEYINTLLALRFLIDENISFRDYLLMIKNVLIEANENQNYSIEALLYNLNIPYEKDDYFPLFDVIIMLDGIHLKKYVKNIKTNSLFFFKNVEGSIECLVEYNSFKYKNETFQKILNHLANLYSNALFNSGCKLEEIEILSKEYKEVLVNTFKDYNEFKKTNDNDLQLLINNPKYVKLFESWNKRLFCDIQKTNIYNPESLKGVQIIDNDKIDFTIHPNIVKKLYEISDNNDISLYVVLVTVFNILLFKYIDNNDIVIISPLLKSKISTNTINDRVLINNTIDNNMSFKDLLINIKDSVLFAYKHQDYPYDEIIRKIYNDVHPSNVVCSLNTIHNIRNIESIQSSIAFNFSKNEDNLKIYVNNNSYKNHFVAQILNHFIAILKIVLEKNYILISDISFLTKLEKHQLLYEFNNTKVEFQEDKLYVNLFIEQVEKNSDVVVAIKGDRQITYRELNNQSDLIAEKLNFYGVKQGEVVGVYLDRGIELLFSIIGIFKTGGVLLLLDAFLPSERINTMLSESGVRVIIGGKKEQKVLEKIKISVSNIENFVYIDDLKTLILEKNREYYNKESIKASDLSYIIYTSGTSGIPKGVMIHHSGMLNHIFSKIEFLQITSSDIIAQTASVSFDICIWQFLSLLLVGGKTYFIDTDTVINPNELILTLQKQRISIFESVPSLIKNILGSIQNIADIKLPYLRWMIPTGEALSASLVRKWYQYYPSIKMVNAYGPTEASDDITHYLIDSIPSTEQLSIPIGKPIRNMQIYILDRHMYLCPIGVVGEICVSGVGVGKGYLGDASKTSKSYVSNPFINEIRDINYSTIYKTGDYGYFYNDGNIECLGRLDNQVKIRGYRIELGEIESRLQTFKSIKDVVVIANGKDEDKFLFAYYVSEEKIEESDLRSYLSSMLPDYMVPSYFLKIEEIPLTRNGKIDKRSLPAIEYKQSKDYISPSNEIESKLAQIWSELLVIPVEKISINANFFELGGHSLKAAILVNKINEIFNIDFSLKEVFQISTVKGMAVLITNLKMSCITNLEYEDIVI